jgi:conjugative relaxase-like TrwC/TraI family protein
MVGKKEHTSSRDLANYHERHLAGSEYHLERGQASGEFFGRLANEWHLDYRAIFKGDVRFKAFAKLDIRALSGTNLARPRNSSRKAIEFTYSAPKSVSVAAVLDPRINDELRAAVREEMDWFEQFAAARDRRGDLVNSETVRTTGKMLAAGFVHETSRAGDPDLHMHCLIANVTIDPERQNALAMDYGGMFDLRKTLDDRIHNTLAARLSRLGYTIEVAQHGFRVREIPFLVEEVHNTRNKEIPATQLLRDGYTVKQLSAVLKGCSAKERSELWISGKIRALLGKPELSPVRKIDEHDIDEQAWLITRRPKEIISPQELRERVEGSFHDLGFVVPKVPSPVPTPFRTRATHPLHESLEQAIKEGTSACLARETLVPLDKLIGEIVRLAPGAVSNAAIAEALADRSEFIVSEASGKRMVTTQSIVEEHKAILDGVKAALGNHERLFAEQEYRIPADLEVTPDRIKSVVEDAKERGEEMTPELAWKWLQQHANVHRYVSTSADRFLNIRGGAGVGKTYCMEKLVQASLEAGRPIILCAPYGEQARVTIRGEATRLEAEGKKKVARVFSEANTVDWLLAKAQFQPAFRESVRGGDIYVDEASLLDNSTALQLINLANDLGARVIFQGDTRQLQPVGRGRPLHLLERELALGLHVNRLDVSRRQLAMEDKRLARDLSSGNLERFVKALDRLIERGSVVEAKIEQAIEAVLKNKRENRETIVLSSSHRLGQEISDRLHDAYKAEKPNTPFAEIAAYRLKDLQPSELKSTETYQAGRDMVEYRLDSKRSPRMARVQSVCPAGLRVHGCRALLPFDRVQTVYRRSILQRGVGEALLLTVKIKQNGKVYENGSRQIIESIIDSKIRFCSGLVLSREDGRVRQGDVVTTYKSQGASKLHMIRFEDNQSLRAMAGQEDLHVGFTRHRATAKMFVESIDVLREIASRSQRNQAAAVGLRQAEPEHAFCLGTPTLGRSAVNGVSPQLGSPVNEIRLDLANTYLQPSLPSENRELVTLRKQSNFARKRDCCRRRKAPEPISKKRAFRQGNTFER